MSTNNRSFDLLDDAATRLKNTAAVTDLLPDGAANIHAGPTARDPSQRDDVELVVRLAGGSAERRGARSQASRLVQVRLGVRTTEFERRGPAWVLQVLDAVEAALGGLGGGGRGPDGLGGAIDPQHDPEEDRYVADTTVRFTTIH